MYQLYVKRVRSIKKVSLVLGGSYFSSLIAHLTCPESFFTLVRTAFSQRRKMLRSSLKQLCPGITSTQRPEELSLEEFLTLYSTSCSTSTVRRDSCNSTSKVQ